MIEHLSEMAPGVELAAALALIDRGRLDGGDLVEVMRARVRQIAYEQAQLLADMVAVTDVWREPDTRLLHHGITRRRPTATDAAYVRARDRRCMFPGCRMPASRCDIDHRRRHTDGGPSTTDNLQPLCRRHHRAKDERGWRLCQFGDSHYLWTSPLGQSYLVRPEPLEPP